MVRYLSLGGLVLMLLTLTACDGLLATTAKPTRPKRQARLYAGGATFLNPMMQKWIGEYEQATGHKVQYQSLGSGAGIEHMTTKAFDFGGTESPLNEAQLKRAKEINGEVLHIPLCMGAVVPTYNLPGVEQPVRFTPKLLSDIFLGQVKSWQDPSLKILNPTITFPDQPITVVHRSDGSGTTFVWTDYLSKVSSEWKAKVGAATSVAWPVGVGHRGNEGVAEFIAKTPFTLGYNELSTAVSKKLQYGWVQNREGIFVRPTLASITAAAAGGLSDLPEDLRYTITNTPGKEAYPIAGTAWAIVYAKQRPDKGKALYDFLWWVTHDGQTKCEHLQYARLPQGLVERIEKKLALIQKDGLAKP